MKAIDYHEAKQLINKTVRWVDIDNPPSEWFQAVVESVNEESNEIVFVDDPTPRSLSHINLAEVCFHPGCTNPHDGWPDDSPDGFLCQEHWEQASAAMWWECVIDLDNAGLIVPRAD